MFKEKLDRLFADVAHIGESVGEVPVKSMASYQKVGEIRVPAPGSFPIKIANCGLTEP